MFSETFDFMYAHSKVVRSLNISSAAGMNGSIMRQSFTVVSGTAALAMKLLVLAKFSRTTC